MNSLSTNFTKCLYQKNLLFFLPTVSNTIRNLNGLNYYNNEIMHAKKISKKLFDEKLVFDKNYEIKRKNMKKMNTMIEDNDYSDICALASLIITKNIFVPFLVYGLTSPTYFDLGSLIHVKKEVHDRIHRLQIIACNHRMGTETSTKLIERHIVSLKNLNKKLTDFDVKIDEDLRINKLIDLASDLFGISVNLTKSRLDFPKLLDKDTQIGKI